ncbi:GspH/FimT family pseudopilin [Aromatoleum petrolei]|nr:GspH/FimT family pseudopilin [Aromatoleum petrolei]QTQ37787.1 Putative type II secretion system protein [Aromatoleum petrolei]
MTHPPSEARPRLYPRQSGFNLLELMVTIAIVGIVAAIAYPSMQEVLAAQRVRAASSALHEALIMARAEALKRNTAINFATTGLGDGWSVQVKADKTEILSHTTFAGVTFEPANPTIEFNSRGRVTADIAVKISATDTSRIMCVQALTTSRISEQEPKDGACP